MEIEGFNEIMDVIRLAKVLHNFGRFDIVKNQFFDIVTYDSWLVNMWAAISSIFSGFHDNYDEDNDTEILIFTDDVISNYYIYAWEYGKKTRTPPDKNPYVKEAENEASQYLNFTFNMSGKLLGYTKSKRAARKSRLILNISHDEFCEHDYLAFGLVYLYKWFRDKCISFGIAKEVKDE